MDRLTAARMTDNNDPSQRQIGDYALISDCETAALIGRTGAIEWLCFPRFDSEACMAAILGDEDNGCWHFEFDGGIEHIERRYRGDSLILETDITCPSGKVRLIDFMPQRGVAPDIVRIVECLDGHVHLTSELFLRFDYGRIHPLVRQCSSERAIAISGPDAVSLDFDAQIEFSDRRFTSQVSLHKGESSSFVLTWFPSHHDVPDRLDPKAALQETEEFWRNSIRNFDYGGRYRDAVMRSVLVLKGLIHLPTGSFVAAPTSSLPENPGGGRNWDYRYCWLRDATLAVQALTRVGLHEEAGAWIGWLRRAVGGDPIDLRPFYTLMGEPRALEWEAPWLSGFMQSRPVRFGNDAQGQLQLDTYGEVIDALYRAAEMGIGDDSGHEDTDLLIRMLASKLEDLWQCPDAGIWESRGEPRHHVYSKAMCWVAFDRAAAWLEERDPDLSRHYRDLARTVRKDVLDNGYDSDRRSFVQAYGEKQLDAAVLRLPLVGLIEADDERMLNTVEAIERELVTEGLVRRYVAEEAQDGLEGAEGAFVAACYWLVDVWYRQGRETEAREMFERLLTRANDLGLLAEELSLKEDMQLGNFPQALSHLSLITAADRLTGGTCGDRPPAQDTQ